MLRFAACISRAGEHQVSYDLVIRNGTIVDGTGAAARPADIGVSGDRIVAVGKVDGKATHEIDASGKTVTPGFVDIHTHLDAQIAWDPIASSSCYHGVTSVVTGNCGVTFAPCKPRGSRLLGGDDGIRGGHPARVDQCRLAVGLGDLRRVPRVHRPDG